jgi:hypothetical protein
MKRGFKQAMRFSGVQMDKEKIDTKILVINSLIKKKNINKLNVLG